MLITIETIQPEDRFQGSPFWNTTITVDLWTRPGPPGAALSNLVAPGEERFEIVDGPAVMRNTRLKPDDVDRLIEAYPAGTGALHLAQEFEISRSALYAHLERREISVRRNPGELSPDEARQVFQLYLSGLSLAAVGEKLGVGHGVVRRELIKRGVARRRRGRV